jgi:HEPN domain-containing protein
MPTGSAASCDDWLRIAHQQKDAYAKLAEDDPTKYKYPIGLLTWQCSENSLKALSAGHKPPHSHDLDKIMRHLQRNGILTTSEISELRPYAGIVTGSRQYSDNKYPEKDPLYWENLSRTSLISICENATNILNFCDNRINLPSH